MTLEEKVAQLSQLPGFPVPEFQQLLGLLPQQVLRKYGTGPRRFHLPISLARLNLGSRPWQIELLELTGGSRQ
jgi:hypothetical protein